MKVNIQCLLLMMCWTISQVSCLDTNTPYVKTPLGGINGHYKISAEGRRYEAYESIPYAMPPIGVLRFEPPVPVPVWPNDIDALKPPTPCIQYTHLDSNTMLGVEDCLYLNIYTPTTNASEALPVIFWIHGGGFQYGTSSNYGAKFLIDKDLILVTINYRLGPFGFLSTGDDIVPGNMGLKDQNLALRWISENIEYFGGNSKRITLAGSSAGGVSVHYHYLSPMSAGLFQNGISFSGTALTPWAHASDTTYATKNLANALNCPTSSSENIIQCLKRIPTYNVAYTYKELMSEFYFPYLIFPPVTEKVEQNYFINDSPKSIIEKNNSNDVPWITGVVSEEGLFITATWILNEKMVELTDKYWEIIAPYMFHFRNVIPSSNNYALLSKLAKKHYFGEKHFSTEWKDVRTLTHMIGDAAIVTGAVRAAQLQAKYHNSPVWFYYYSYRAAQSVVPRRTNTTENLGVCHYDDIFLVLENVFIDPTTTEKDRAMLQDMLNFWKSVATAGQPNLRTTWTKLKDSNTLQYMHIAGPGNFTMGSNANFGETLFWQEIGL